MTVAPDFLRRNVVTVAMIAAVFATAVALGVYFFNRSIAELRMDAEDHFRLEINSIIAHAVEKYKGGVTTLRALQGFFAGSEKVTRKEFYDFIRTSNFFSVYKGFSSIAYVRRVSGAQKEDFLADMRSDASVRNGGYPAYAVSPEGTRDEYWPIVYIDPENKLDFLLGSDQLVDAVRGENIARARDIGDVSLSPSTQLKQGGVGVLIAAPLYRGGTVPGALEDRRLLFDGAVTAAFTVEDFFKDILSPYDLKNRGTSIVVTGRTNALLPLLTASVPNDFLTRLFGVMRVTRTLEVDANRVQLAFTAPAKSYLTAQEQFEPFELALIFFSSAVFMSALIVLFQRMKLISDLKNRYEFIATLSHQLRTPLSDLRWQIEAQGVAGKEKDTYDAFMGNVLVLNSILGRMLLYIEMTKGNIGINKSEVGVERLYEGVLRAVAKTRDASRVERLGEKPILKKLVVDEEKIVTALLYVIENALTYSPAEKKVAVELAANNNTFRMTVTDHGYGIPVKEQKKVFSPFFRASNASLGINYGSGVSIFMAREIIEMHDGTLQFISKENEGSVFTITLPLA